ncbi:hypothetical protein [Flavobacterium sp.]|uniref:hypothetical protein n=1 Tax=Flavobacterium sp. TaxID=239 RepID=UPI002624F1C0|nr:hypothetical protein [Flavobacterium sp.]MDD2987136.1 hypothetical protein [Flavobacterium sp.]
MRETLDFLSIQNHINRNYKRWIKRYDNIEGVHIGEKKIKGKIQKNNFSIVFHVTRKTLNPEKSIPNYFYIRSGSLRLRVSSDVIETGKLVLHGIQMGDATKSTHHHSYGSISIFFATSKGTYVGSNMHVLAPDLLERGIRNYNRKQGGNFEVLLYNRDIMTTAVLYASIFKGIDFGFAKVKSPEFIENKIRRIGDYAGFYSFNRSNYKNARLFFSGANSGLKECVLQDIFVTKNYYDTQFNNLLKLNFCSTGGDSGAPVFDRKFRIVGFILGADQVEQASYALSINDIISYFQSLNL